MKPKSPSNRVPKRDSLLCPQALSSNVSVLPRTLSVFLLAGMLSFGGCDKENGTAEIGSPAEMGETLNKSLPKGTPLQTAKDFMLKEGFTCEPKLDSKWKGKAHINFLHCKREDGTPPIKRLWEAAVIHDGTSVLAVDLRSGFIYP